MIKIRLEDVNDFSGAYFLGLTFTVCPLIVNCTDVVISISDSISEKSE